MNFASCAELYSADLVQSPAAYATGLFSFTAKQVDKFFKEMEDIFNMFENVSKLSPNYQFFVPARQKRNPYIINTRCFSCNLIKTNLNLRWRGLYNEDVILSLDILKTGDCILLLNTHLIDKITTQVLKGGNTDQLYKDGTAKKSLLLKQVHPLQVEIVERYGRVHHKVNYSNFKQKLKLNKNFNNG